MFIGTYSVTTTLVSAFTQVKEKGMSLLSIVPGPPGSSTSRFGNLKQASSRPPGGFFDAKTSSETLRKRNGSFPSVKSDSPASPRSPREAQPPVSGISNKHLQGLPGAFLASRGLFWRQTIFRNVAKTQRFVDDDVVYWYSFSKHYTKRAFTQP